MSQNDAFYVCNIVKMSFGYLDSVPLLEDLHQFWIDFGFKSNNKQQPNSKLAVSPISSLLRT